MQETKPWITSVMFAATAALSTGALGQQLFFEDFTDGALDDATNGTFFDTTGGSYVNPNFIAPNAGRGAASALGFNMTTTTHSGFRWVPDSTTSWDPINNVTFIRQVLFSDAYADYHSAFVIVGDINGKAADALPASYYPSMDNPGPAPVSQMEPSVLYDVTLTGIANNTKNSQTDSVWDVNPFDATAIAAALDQNRTVTYAYRGALSGSSSTGETLTVEFLGPNSTAKFFVDNTRPMSTLDNVTPALVNLSGTGVGTGTVVLSNLTGGNSANAQAGWLSYEIGVTKATDFNLDYSTDVNDLLIWNTNKFTGTGSSGSPAGGVPFDGNTMAQGDATNDGVTDVNDLLAWNTNKFTSSGSAPLAASLMASGPPGTPVFFYNPDTGELTVEANGSDLVGFTIVVSLDAESGAVVTANNLPQGPLGNWWSATIFNHQLQFNDTSILLDPGNAFYKDGVMPTDFGPAVIAQLALGLDEFDFGLVNYGGDSTGSGQTVVMVPEPATMMLLAVGVGAALGRRRAA